MALLLGAEQGLLLFLWVHWRVLLFLLWKWLPQQLRTDSSRKYILGPIFFCRVCLSRRLFFVLPLFPQVRTVPYCSAALLCKGLTEYCFTLYGFVLQWRTLRGSNTVRISVLTVKTLLSLPNLIQSVNSELAAIIGEDLPILTEIRNFTVDSGGKRIRPILLILLSRANKAEEGGAVALGAITEIIHASSLLHDDVIDEAVERRGKPSGRKLFGNKQVILGGDYLLSCGIDRLNDFKNPDLMTVFTRALRNLSVAELIQMEYAGRTDITNDIYDRIIYGKTASLFETAAEAAAIYSGLSAEKQAFYAVFGKNLGMFFQLRDDYLDYFNAGLLQKPALTDFENGLITFPLLAAREVMPQSVYSEITDWMSRPPETRKEPGTRKKLLKLFDEHGVELHTRKILLSFKESFVPLLRELPQGEESAMIEGQIEKLSSF